MHLAGNYVCSPSPSLVQIPVVDQFLNHPIKLERHQEETLKQHATPVSVSSGYDTAEGSQMSESEVSHKRSIALDDRDESSKRVKQPKATDRSLTRASSAKDGKKQTITQTASNPKGKNLETVIIRDKTIGTGKSAQVGDQIGIYYQVRDRNGTALFRQLEGQLVRRVYVLPRTVAKELFLKTSIHVGQGSVVKGITCLACYKEMNLTLVLRVG